jgi:hypothetical protein
LSLTKLLTLMSEHFSSPGYISFSVLPIASMISHV